MPPHATATSPRKEMRAAHGKRQNKSVRQAGIDVSPTCAVVGGNKHAISSRKEIRAVDGERQNRSARQAGIDGGPACAVVGGKENAALFSSRKEIRAVHCKGSDRGV